MQEKPVSAQDYIAGVLRGDRLILSQAITLIESTREDHRQMAQEVIKGCLPYTGHAFRLGITGAPGVGKSTFIDALGMHLITSGKSIAVLAVDPSSQKTGGSILGDKTRMTQLSRDEKAFIRPSPNSGTLGGIANQTREAMLLCEAAGYDVVFVETVGVGQSEFSVHQMVDMLLLLLITGAGDDLQGIKRGIMEMADLIVINKSDGENEQAAKQLSRLIRQTVHVLPDPRKDWETEVVQASSIDRQGFDEIAAVLSEFERTMRASNAFEDNRSEQALSWMRRHIEEGLLRRLTSNPEIVSKLTSLEQEVTQGKRSPINAAEEILSAIITSRSV